MQIVPFYIFPVRPATRALTFSQHKLSLRYGKIQIRTRRGSIGSNPRLKFCIIRRKRSLSNVTAAHTGKRKKDMHRYIIGTKVPGTGKCKTGTVGETAS